MGWQVVVPGLWRAAPLVVIDLEGSGAQDGKDEAILEIAAVPLVAGQPVVADAYSSLVNPGRSITARRWLAPGLTDALLAQAPSAAEITAPVTALLHGAVVIGHNVTVDWRLLHRHYPHIVPVVLLDTLRLARHLHPALSYSLTALLQDLRLTDEVNLLVPAATAHRALWDAVGAGMLFGALVGSSWPPAAAPTAKAVVAAAWPVTIASDDDGQLSLFPDQ